MRRTLARESSTSARRRRAISLSMLKVPNCPHLSSADHEGYGTKCIEYLCAGSGTNVMQGTKITEFSEHAQEYHVNVMWPWHDKLLWTNIQWKTLSDIYVRIQQSVPNSSYLCTCFTEISSERTLHEERILIAVSSSKIFRYSGAMFFMFWAWMKFSVLRRLLHSSI